MSADRAPEPLGFHGARPVATRHEFVDGVVREARAVDGQVREARALELAKAHHAAMGPAMRDHLNPAYVVLDWLAMPKPRRDVMVAVMRALLDQGVVT